MRVVIDTNVIISSFFGQGPPYQIMRRLKKNEFTICLSGPILEEYIEISKRLSIDLKRVKAFHLELLNSKHLYFNTPPKINMHISDSDDIIFFECAEALEAIYIVSGDSDILDVGKYNGIRCITPRAFLDILNNAL